ncbi:hypothetical protein tb265_27370 [Gemmatimonadetes bacterium T265]|nr:hypothetical protein tb265_27370 [Gemmatimonadetes bacterium T265]
MRPGAPPPLVVRLAAAAAAAAEHDAEWLAQWLAARDVRAVEDVDQLVAVLTRSRPEVVLLDAHVGALNAVAACKRDAYTALVPCVVHSVDRDRGPDAAALFDAGADEVLRADLASAESVARLDAAVRRAARDLAAQPTTGLPGPPAIERLLAAYLRDGVPFAACYADLDHFKEYNDRYGFHEGDRVIRMVARLLHDVALGAAGRDASVAHIGGDDFLCVLPLDRAAEACATMVETFDLLAPLQYNAADRRAGYYLGKDRRGQLHRVPLMTLSIGVATTERRRFESAADVSRLASEMKSFAKTLPGSVFAFDRRGDDAGVPPAPIAELE